MIEPRDRFERLVARHREALYGHCLKLTRGRDRAEDLLQTALLRAWRFFERFDGENFRAWAMTIATNVHIEERKRRHHHAETNGHAPELFESAGSADDVHGEVAARELPAEVRAALARLPGAFRAAVLMVDVGGMSYEEAAAASGVPVGTVRSRLSRARSRLRGEFSGGGTRLREA